MENVGREKIDGAFLRCFVLPGVPPSVLANLISTFGTTPAATSLTSLQLLNLINVFQPGIVVNFYEVIIIASRTQRYFRKSKII